MSTCLTVENAQSHVTAFRPISEAARSWSDDNAEMISLTHHMLTKTKVHQQRTYFQNMFFSKRAPKQKGGCLDTPWIRHCVTSADVCLQMLDGSECEKQQQQQQREGVNVSPDKVYLRETSTNTDKPSHAASPAVSKAGCSNCRFVGFSAKQLHRRRKCFMSNTHKNAYMAD